MTRERHRCSAEGWNRAGLHAHRETTVLQVMVFLDLILFLFTQSIFFCHDGRMLQKNKYVFVVCMCFYMQKLLDCVTQANFVRSKFALSQIAV